MTADAIAVSVTWFKLGSRHTSKVTGTSFAHILLRDGEVWCINSCRSIKAPTQDQYISGMPNWEISHFVLAISDTPRKHTSDSELFASNFNAAFCT